MNERTEKKFRDQGEYPKFAIDICQAGRIDSSLYFDSLIELVAALPAIARQEASATSLDVVAIYRNGSRTVIAEVDPATQTLDIVQQH